ncbi:MAG: hypothetical protein RMM98_01895 [Acidobacteriota bacterium]|nr:hypothetical protein [Blastocatellia bacterium]MDW8238340.1 hypothetical protein [Acidobacteriota bacterium]
MKDNHHSLTDCKSVERWLIGTVLILLVRMLTVDAGTASRPTPMRHQHEQRPFYVLFDNTKGETAGNADWVIDATGNDPLRVTPIVPLPPNPLVETDWDGALSSWGVELTRSGRARANSLPAVTGRITFNDVTNPQDLSKYHVFVVCEPNIEFTVAERQAIIAFVENGGGLFIIGNHLGSDRNNDGVDAPRIWNNLFLQATQSRLDFGLRFNLVNIARENPDLLGDLNDPDVHAIVHGPFGDVRGTILRSGADMLLEPMTNPAARGVLFRRGFSPSGRSGVVAAFSRVGRGRIFALGDSSPADDGTGDPTDDLFNGWRDPAGTNRELILNATVWLAGSATVSDEPTLIGITPRAVPAGRTLTLLINARNSHFVAGQTTAWFGDDIVVNAISVTDAETLMANITVPLGAPAGSRTVRIVTGNQVIEAPDSLIIP